MAYPVHYVPAGDVLPIFFDTFDGGTGASITMTGLAVTDIEIYKDGSATQRASDAGYTLLDTDGIDFDGLTGIHGFSIDTGDNTDAGFYTVGAWFHVVVSAVTVDAQTVSFIAAAFRIMAAEGVAGVPDVNATHWNDTAVTTPPAVNVTQLSGDSTAADNAEAFFDGTGYAGTNNVIPTVTTLTGHTAQTGDAYARLGAPAGASVSADIAAVKAETANIVADTNELQGDWANGGRLDLILDTAAAGGDAASFGIVDEGTAQSATGTTLVLRAAAGFADDELIGATVLITGGTGVGQSRVITDYVGSTDTATVDTWTTTPSGTITYKVFGTPPASATAVPAVNLVQVAGSTTDVSALATNVAAILVDTGTTLDGKLNTIDDFLDTEVAAILAAVDTEVAAILADTNELQTDWANGGRLDLLLDGAASAGDPWTTALPGAYGAGTAGYIIGTDLASVLADTNELQTDWANGGRLDLLLDGAASAGDPWTTELPGAYGAGTAGKIVGDNLNATVSSRASQTSVDTVDDLLDTEVAAIKTVVDAVKVKTDQLAFTATNKVDANILNVNSQDIGATKPYDTAT